MGDSSVDRRKLDGTDDLGPFTVELDRSAIREVAEIVKGPVGPRHRRRRSHQPSADRSFRASFADAENSSRRQEALIQAGLMLAAVRSTPACGTTIQALVLMSTAVRPGSPRSEGRT